MKTKLNSTAFVFVILLFLGCALWSCQKHKSVQGDRLPPENSSNQKPTSLTRELACLPAASQEHIEPLSVDQNKEKSAKTFVELSDALRPHCAGCHAAPLKKSGDFAYADSYSDATLTDGTGHAEKYAGIVSSAEKIQAALVSGSMPPVGFKTGNEASLAQLQSDFSDWITAGKPEGTFLTQGTVSSVEKDFQPVRVHSTDLGDCIPLAAAVGFDAEKDALFDALEALPSKLSATDFTTLDTFELARHGTVAYNTEYPLWADDAKKTRYVHFPASKNSEGKFTRQPALYNSVTQSFSLPENARFYKSFFKDVKQVDGVVRQRIIETRLIVVRHAPRTPLFGTYQWNAAQTEATLVAAPYRDGTPWKDVVEHVEIDESTHATRLYAIPGRQRCSDCHQGSDSFTLGFTPLQLNRRKAGDAGNERAPEAAELSQVDRLVVQGFLSGFLQSDILPKLENSGRELPANIHALRAQGYFVGNCAHCHNPSGTALKDTEVKLDLTAGKLFPFVPVAPAEGGNLTFLGPAGDLSQSLLFRRISRIQNSFGKSASPMPMHIAGGPDCRLVTLVGKWLKSFESLEAANAYQPLCNAQTEVTWLDLDFTSLKSATYLPRRSDWNARSALSMPDSFQKLELTDELLAVSRKKYPTGYFQKKADSVCAFPKVPLPPDAPAWADRQRNWGEAYFQTPGSFYYSSTCAHCHGRKGNGQSGLATSLLYYSNGAIQVADFSQGLFGNDLKNLDTFNVTENNGKTHNLAPQYLVWMAHEGTLFNFPGDLDSYLGKGHANMLFSLGERCSLLLRRPQPGQINPANAPDALLNKDICTFNNPITPEVGFDDEGGAPINIAAQNAWKDRASYNAALSVFTFLKEQAFSPGIGFPAREKECEKVYPAHASP